MSFDARAIARQFPILAAAEGEPPLHYLDNAATTQIPRPVLDAVSAHETGARANVSRGVHRLAEAATDAYEGARGTVARFLGAAGPREVVFTSGTTGAINLVAHAYGDGLAAGDEIVLSEAEHHSNLLPWQQLARRTGVKLRFLPVTPEGRVDAEAVERTVTPRCRLLAVTHCSNVSGALTDVSRIVGAARSVGARVLLDGAQAAPHLNLDVAALGIDFYAFSGHKMYAPNGVGVLWGRSEVLEAMPPFLSGGGTILTATAEDARYAESPRRFEAGTPPIAQAVGLGAAMAWLEGIDRGPAAAHLELLTGRLIAGLEEMEGVRLVGPGAGKQRLGVVSFVVDGVHPHDVCQVADGRGVAVRGGHHCAQPLMAALGITGTVRASLAYYNHDGDVDALLAGVAEATERLR